MIKREYEKEVYSAFMRDKEKERNSEKEWKKEEGYNGETNQLKGKKESVILCRVRRDSLRKETIGIYIYIYLLSPQFFLPLLSKTKRYKVSSTYLALVPTSCDLSIANETIKSSLSLFLTPRKDHNFVLRAQQEMEGGKKKKEKRKEKDRRCKSFLLQNVLPMFPRVREK